VYAPPERTLVARPAAPAPAAPRPHLVQLDALRAFAVLGVLVSHFMHDTPRLRVGGPWGVRLFFVLSGFLITGILLECRAAIARDGGGVAFTLRQFYARRALRIAPVYYATLLAAWLLGVPAVREGLWWHVAYLSNLHFALTDSWHAPLSHFWSLAVEEQFYLAWPLLVLLAPARLLLPAMALAVAAAPAYRWLCAAAGVRDMVLWTLPFTALDSLGVGALLAAGSLRWPRARAACDGRWLAWATGALLLLVAAIQLPWALQHAPLRWLRAGPLYETVLSLASAGVVLGAARRWRGPVGRLLEWPPLGYLGRISYGVYVVHLFMVPAVPALFAAAGLPYPAAEGWARFALLTAASVAVAAASWHWLERPLNDLKRHFPYRRDDARAVVEGG
jgi:peptidoglycan/LPS O-acetylase OafA/YrhL